MRSRYGSKHAECVVRALGCLFLCLFTFAATADADLSDKTTALEPGQSITSELRADQSLEFQLALEAGTAYLVEIDQGGFDLVIDLTDADGATRGFNYPTLRIESELLLIEPEQTGMFTLRVFTEDFTGAVARPIVSLKRLAPDDALLPAYRLLTTAAFEYHESDWQASLDALNRAEPMLDDSATPALLARCRLGISRMLSWEAYEFERAGQWARSAETAYREAGNDRLAAAAVQQQGVSLVDLAVEIEKTPSLGLAPEALAQMNEALRLLHASLEARQRLPFPYDTALNLNMIGYAHHMMGEYEAALESYRQAAREFHDLQEWQSEANTLSNIGVVTYDRGYLIQAIETLDSVLATLPPDGADYNRAWVLSNLGMAHSALGNLDLALKYLTASLEISSALDDLAGRAGAFTGIGQTYLDFGETELGLDYLEAALPLSRQSGHGMGLVSTLNALGRHYRNAGDFEASLAAHREAERVATAPRDRARTLLYLGEVYIVSGDLQGAFDTLARADPFTRELQIRVLRGRYLKLNGDALLDADRPAEALASYSEAESLYAELGLATGRSQCLSGMSRSHAALGQTEPAIDRAIQAIDEVEAMRGTFATPQLRAFFMAQRQDYYAHVITLLVDSQKAGSEDLSSRLGTALNFSERSRARSLMDLVNEAAQQRSAAGDSSERDALYRELAEARHRLSLEEPDTDERRRDISATRRQLAEIENRLNLLEIELRESDPALKGLADPVILDVADIQAMLDPETALLQYALGSQRSHVFLVTDESVHAWPLPDKSRIETVARDLYTGLSVPARARADRETLATQIDAFSRLILPPAEALVQPRLLVVADGVLQYLPFTVLLGANGSDAAGGDSLVHEVVNVPSMSVLAAQREHRANNGEPARTVTIFADPVFGGDDPRLAGSTVAAEAEAPGAQSRQSSYGAHGGDLERLPATRYEAETIAQLVEPGSRHVRTGFDANRDAILNHELSDFRFVHFATHGRIDARYPLLSWLAFSRFDETGAARDGLVRLHDIYDLELNAELVTMSACETALGREISGEGLTGLVQGFMYAGARSVLASLWQVPDRATAELMGSFYRNLLEADQAPAEALRNAQLELSSRKRFQHPYYWSAFVLQGDWK